MYAKTVALAFVLLVLPLSTARADYINPVLGATPVGLCQGSLPAYETSLRKRPLAMQNEGATTVFVSCGIVTDVAGYPTVQISLRFNNTTASNITIFCVLANGRLGNPVTYFPKSISAAPGISESLSWRPEDNNGSMFTSYLSLSCALPPGTGITSIFADTFIPVVSGEIPAN